MPPFRSGTPRPPASRSRSSVSGSGRCPNREVDGAFGRALEVGYRYIDTARIYGNEAGVGRVLASTDVPRDDIFVTTKVWNDDHRDVPAAFDASMERLGLETLDLYLIHWPALRSRTPTSTPGRPCSSSSARDGSARSASATSRCRHLQRLLDETGVLPSINQVELSPYLQQRELRGFHAEHGIVTEAWSPLAVRAGLLDDQSCSTSPTKHGVTPAQVVLRWHIELGNVVLTRSVTPGPHRREPRHRRPLPR